MVSLAANVRKSSVRAMVPRWRRVVAIIARPWRCRLAIVSGFRIRSSGYWRSISTSSISRPSILGRWANAACSRLPDTGSCSSSAGRPGWACVCGPSLNRCGCRPTGFAFAFSVGSSAAWVSTHLTGGSQETLIEEVYEIPLVPDLSWIRPMVGRVVDRGASHVWSEDLAVELCHGGWPGVPGRDAETAPSSAPPGPLGASARSRWVRVAEQTTVADGRSRTVEVDGRTIVLWRHRGRFYALDNVCPHTGGPLSLGWIEDDQIVCPWHGARFAVDSGLPCSGPVDEDDAVAAYPVRLNDGGVLVQLPAFVPEG